MDPTFFPDRQALRGWFEQNHHTTPELWVGYYKVGSGKPTVTWSESVDEALCFGWIDSVRKRLGPDAYMNRFTPRKRGSNWSAANVRRTKELIDLGLVRPSGLAAFEARKPERTAVYSYERRPVDLPEEFARAIRANPSAWSFWQAASPSYRKAAAWWILSARKDDTRARRLTTLIEASANGERVPPLRAREIRR